MFIDDDDEWAWYKRQSDETHDFSNVRIVGQNAFVSGVQAYTTSDEAWVMIEKSELQQLAQKQQQLDECLRQLQQLQAKYRKDFEANEARQRERDRKGVVVLKRYLNGMSVREIVEDTGIKKSSCYNIIKKYKGFDVNKRELIANAIRNGELNG